MNRRELILTAAAMPVAAALPAVAAPIVERYKHVGLAFGYMVFSTDKQTFRWSDQQPVDIWAPP